MLRALGGATCAALLAGSPSAALSERPGKRTANPDEVVCEKIEVPGSRLIAKKVCLTRAQWAERKLQERSDLDQMQTQRGTASRQ